MTGKEAVARAAADLIQPHTVLGLGSGTTASLFIRALATRRIPLKCVASSLATAALATSLHLPLLDINDAPPLDLTVDGADQIDPQKRMIKGGGGAHTRERILASCARNLLILVDASKLVDRLHGSLPIEVLAYGSHATRKKIEALGYKVTARNALSDNGNPLLDVTLPSRDLTAIQSELRSVPGVVDTGLFLTFSPRVLVGHPNGKVADQ